MPASLPVLIAALRHGRHLSELEARDAIGVLMRGEAAEPEVGALLTAWRDAGVTVDELVGAARAMRAAAVPITVPSGVLVDTCGTGGDKLDTFNISTVTALIVAGAGVRVAKHGNRGSTSRCGSADLLEKLGVKIDPEPAVVARCIDEVGFGFLFAQKFHPAMKHVSPARKRLGFRTIFNLLGPLTNPAKATHQLVGISDATVVDAMVQALRRLGSQGIFAAHGAKEHMDEVSTVGPTRVVEYREGKSRSYTITPEEFGISPAPLSSLGGRDQAHCAEVALAVLRADPKSQVRPYRDASLLNAGCALYLCGKATSIHDGLALARRSLDGGQALEILERVVRLTTS